MQTPGSAYKTILDQSFRRYFPDWDKVSPLDPTRVISDALAIAAEEIEKKQNRFVETVLDTLPSLFAFAPKTGRLPSGIFSIVPTARLAEPRDLAPAQFRFQGDGPLRLIRPLGGSLIPVTGVKVLADAQTVTIGFQTRGALAEIPLTYLPAETAMSEGIHPLEISVFFPREGRRYYREDLEIDDNTDGLRRFGRLTLRSLRHHYLVEAAADVEISLRFKAAPSGTFTFNAFECEIFETQSNFRLGELRGDPWESIDLPEAVLSPPDEIELRFPNDHYQTLKRVDDELLRRFAGMADKNEHAYFYDAAHHRLIVPAAHRLCGRYFSGVSVVAPEQRLVPRTPWFDASYQGSPGEWVAQVEKIAALRLLQPGLPRESREDYLIRFYGMIRRFIASGAPTGRFADLVEDAVRNADDAIARVESTYDEASKEISLNLLSRGNANWSDLTLRLEPKLAKIIPLECRYRLVPFRMRAYALELRLSLAARGGEMTPTQVSVAQFLREKLATLTDARSLTPGHPLTLPELREKLGRRLGEHFGLQHESITKFDLQLFDRDRESFVDRIERRAGEEISIEPQLTLEILREGARS